MKATPLAELRRAEVLDLIGTFCEIGRDLPSPHASPPTSKPRPTNQIRVIRIERSAPVVAEIKAWAPTVSITRKHIREDHRGMLDHWTGLTAFLESPWESLDNNLTDSQNPVASSSDATPLRQQVQARNRGSSPCCISSSKPHRSGAKTTPGPSSAAPPRPLSSIPDGYACLAPSRLRALRQSAPTDGLPNRACVADRVPAIPLFVAAAGVGTGPTLRNLRTHCPARVK